MTMTSEMSVKKLKDDVETVDEFCNFGNTLHDRGGSEMTVGRRKIGCRRESENGKRGSCELVRTRVAEREWRHPRTIEF